MAVTFVTGPAGAGKTEWLYRKILETAEQRRDRMVLVIVPEQFSLQTMQEILLRSRTKSMSNIEVLSFMRLSYRIFEELGVETGQLLSDIGKSLILKRVLNRIGGELRLFASGIKKAGFLDETKSLLSEFYQYGITPEQVTQLAAGEEDPVLAKKLSEIALIFQEFQEAIAGKYLPTETISDRLAAVIADSRILDGCTVFFDGYTGFTPSQYGLLKELFRKAEECYLTLTMESSASGVGEAGGNSRNSSEHGLFHLTFRTRQVVAELAEAAGCKTEELCLASDAVPPRFSQAPALAALERGLFRYPLPPRVSCENQVAVYALANRSEEAAFIAADLARRVRTEQLRYCRIAIITGDIDGYGELLLSELTRARIPAFLDKKRRILHNPCITLLRAVLQNAQNNYSFDSVFRFLKSSLVDFEERDISILENYCLACGIRGESTWKKEWKYRYRTDETLDLKAINSLRSRVVEQLSEITHRLLEEPTAGQKTRALYDFLVRNGVEEKLSAAADAFEEQQDPVRAGEYRQVYRNVLELFDHVIELLDTEEVTLREYIELMETGFSEGKVGLVPSSLDSVVIGDLMRTRLGEIDLLYLVGVNEGVTPAPISGGGLISDLEREKLAEHAVELAPGKKETACTEQFYLYSVLTKPRKGLVMTFSRLSSEGSALQPSWFLTKIRDLYSDLKLREEEPQALLSLLKNDEGHSYLLNGIRRLAEGETITDTKFWELYRMESLKRRDELDRLLHTAFVGNETGKLSEQTAKRLYGAVLFGSVTRMEKYASCAFAHFIQYGLELSKRAEYKIEAPELGSLYHEALEIFTQKVRNEGLSWHGLETGVRERLCEESVMEAVAAVENQVFSGSERNKYLVVKAKRILQRAVAVLQKQIQGGLFEPEHCEISFEHSSKYVSLHGKIDRYDVCENEGKWYLRVMDYKSSEKTFDLSELYYGLQIQLEVYLAAAKQLAEKEHAAGMNIAGAFYFQLADPFLPRDKYSEEAVLQKLRPNGILNRAPSAVTAMDRSFYQENGGLCPGVKSRLIPAETNKTGDLAAANATDEEGFTELMEYTYRKLDKQAQEIYTGEAGARPYRQGQETPCKYCNYKQICGFDNRLPGFEYRELPKLTAEEVWKKVREE